MNLIVLIRMFFSVCFLLMEANPKAVDFMRQTGKINVVFGVITIVFLGIIIFLIYLERKISQIEKKINND